MGFGGRFIYKWRNFRLRLSPWLRHLRLLRLRLRHRLRRRLRQSGAALISDPQLWILISGPADVLDLATQWLATSPSVMIADEVASTPLPRLSILGSAGTSASVQTRAKARSTEVVAPSRTPLGWASPVEEISPGILRLRIVPRPRILLSPIWGRVPPAAGPRAVGGPGQALWLTFHAGIQEVLTELGAGLGGSCKAQSPSVGQRFSG